MGTALFGYHLNLIYNNIFFFITLIIVGLNIWPWTWKKNKTKKEVYKKVIGLVELARKKGGDQEGDFIEYLVANGCSDEVISRIVDAMAYI